MIIKGSAIAEEIYQGLAPRFIGVEAKLGLITAGTNPASESFIAIKQRAATRLGVSIQGITLSSHTTTGEVIDAVAKLSQETDGIIVQLPLPDSVHTDGVLMALPAERDVDALNLGIDDADKIVRAPIVGALEEIFTRTNVSVGGKNATVIGAGRLVGSPASSMLRRGGALVSVVTTTTGTLEKLQDADIIVSGAGSFSLVQPHMIKGGVVLIDAGVSEVGGHIKGDIDMLCAPKASVFASVPGGIGPIAVSMIFKNLLILLEKNKK